jgi:hypothetical protein
VAETIASVAPGLRALRLIDATPISCGLIWRTKPSNPLTAAFVEAARAFLATDEPPEPLTVADEPLAGVRLPPTSGPEGREVQSALSSAESACSTMSPSLNRTPRAISRQAGV